MKSILEVLNASTDFLAKKGVESPRLQTELIMAHVLEIGRMQLYLEFERVLNEKELAPLREMIKRRGRREPLQHIIEETEFHGLKVKCSPKALVPRPETEYLVELVVKKLGENAQGVIYDIGTGSGVIALSLAHELNNAEFVAVDVDDHALRLAEENGAAYPHLKVSWQKGDLLKGVKDQGALAVVANLPYLTSDEMKHLNPEVQQDPYSALHGGEDGLDLVRHLIKQSVEIATWIFLEIGIKHGSIVKELLLEAGYIDVEVHEDLLKRERFVVAKKAGES
ncbi:MAG: peptide chain release factor N(5)-glutamine methyltransferase [Verrucomicrobiota bacterium]